MVRAALLPAVGEPLRLTEIVLPEPGPGKVRVKLAAAGVCHSDLSLTTGVLRPTTPVILGHEGAGTVVSVGEGVTGVRPGDPVVLNWAPACGRCHLCGLGEPWLCENQYAASVETYAALPDGTGLYPGLGAAAFAEETVVNENAVIPLPEGVPLTSAAVLGCAVLTGYGAVHNAARVRAGESVVVFGLGGVGLAVLQAARIAGAAPIIAVDVSPEKEELALRHGATAFVVADEQTPKAVRRLTDGNGADHAFECVGRGSTIRAAWSSTRRGGRTTVVGIGGKDDLVSFSALEVFHFARTLTACCYGNSDPVKDIPVLAEHVRAGRLDLEALITDRITLDGIPDAFLRMASGQGGRSLVVF
ncbi:Zn-dependent alcohol dehydrogenase [Streptacidiphilus sp. PB12-B1b]|uniref:Zn-dependent alcohol dehydrogenase n=1 Tax=Streptacidiphilus sp. PB12-B1b TaxID=2705012 RepID=UPI0015F9C451|nr:Zn-dependent alcohol dehydrogenase [Streptacidiphilus sp. PB12-B1b]QMU80124.1 Zn-dependent alcohol dehydrogenase [Streptacidiphilus sp. PB12-B1b]